MKLINKVLFHIGMNKEVGLKLEDFIFYGEKGKFNSFSMVRKVSMT